MLIKRILVNVVTAGSGILVEGRYTIHSPNRVGSGATRNACAINLLLLILMFIIQI
jgi:hypothetical protein